MDSSLTFHYNCFIVILKKAKSIATISDIIDGDGVDSYSNDFLSYHIRMTHTVGMHDGAGTSRRQLFASSFPTKTVTLIMGFCTRFRKTWWPGYGHEVIDPNKVFDFQRRIIIVKRVVIVLLVAAILAGILYWLITSCAFGSASEVPNSERNTTEEKPNVEPPISSEALIFQSEFENGTTETPLKEEKNVTEVSLGCLSKQNMTECVALSKNFKSITTFLSSRKPNSTVEGYVLVKLGNSTWHPYCRSNWTLEIAYGLCKGLGFQQLLRLQTIDILHLKQRITKPAKEVTLNFDDNLQPPSLPSLDLLVLDSTKDGSSSQISRVSSKDKHCDAGFLSCN